ncbi:MAG: DUF488 domain-containing protein [Marinisporobacter sp.]|jgi:uncharacterized protein (DUF488 family)|nr:DUF488 domain-containing protein [Marinisporobacter sp.]
MIKIYTIGFTKKSAQQFFELLERNNIKTVFDVRLNNSSQLSGFAKGKDLQYFLRQILSVGYIHNIEFSPTKEILNNYKKGKIDWEKYERQFSDLLSDRKLERYIKEELFSKLDGMCFLCSEATPEKCHRRLVAEYIRDLFKNENIEIIHI